MIENISRRAFGGSSGTYHVRASERERERNLKFLSATVTFLDDSQHTFQLDKKAKGQELLDKVFQHLELVEKDYFGLQFSENGNPPCSSNNDLMRWLDPLKLVKKQLRHGQLFFRVKFYVTDPSKLHEEYTRYHFFLQLRRDILDGKLIVPASTACLLASYIVQSELGDYHSDDHAPGYLSQLPLIPGQNEEMEKKVAELHKLHKGQTPADAEFNFLDHAKRLEMYGVDLHKAMDDAGKEIQLGVTSLGLVVFHNGIRINLFSWAKIIKISFKRKQFFINLRREPQCEEYDTVLGFNMQSYRSSKNLWKSCVEHHTFFRLHTPRARARRFVFTLGSKFRYSGRTEFQTVEECKRRARLERTFIRSPSKKIVRHTVPICDEKQKTVTTSSRAPRVYDNKVQSLGREPKKAWEDSAPSDDEGGFLETLKLPRTIDYIDIKETERPAFDIPPYIEAHEDALVKIRISPDVDGRFGFNVKGGSDLGLPILVSRVAPNTPADCCYPRLNEGDQVLLINGRETSGLTHDQVVNLIRTSRDSQSGELVLTVRPNVYETREAEEPAFQYVLDVQHVPSAVPKADALAESILLLAETLESGSAMQQFEQLYRKKPGLSAEESKKAENICKNRYRDISPYDATRVILTECESGDYINANTVNMEIPGSGIINRYIATQGPLPSTVGDFWHMVHESQSTLVVMLTTVVERGRVKCHKYWPSSDKAPLEMESLQVSCSQESEDESFSFREFTLKNTKTGEERQISHMQYLAWPDHGVPDECSEFIDFCKKVRQARAGTSEPVIVHCSAGIGRTGVLVLMETAMCLIEANEPVYPLDIVRTMRDQRAMMIQTPVQYRFVCESVHRAYQEEIVKPLPEYQK
ncbi:tyrosine-protein phosphatase non-receptor type 4 isoform X2 [Neocloeon triangulifer]|uniref:tyrosine-protein phosphatase non-receptor type 4 isoform X2 n=1 Tax=Neocloeon triangulifer TaxID=2078957 RepID=UPI00286F1ACE|nr:tyrosine-protein phosphatase non-receptor type 4 isoform X2 [Neocloeon triangulifer]